MGTELNRLPNVPVQRKSLQHCEGELAKIGDGWPIPVLESEIATVGQPELAA